LLFILSAFSDYLVCLDVKKSTNIITIIPMEARMTALIMGMDMGIRSLRQTRGIGTRTGIGTIINSRG